MVIDVLLARQQVHIALLKHEREEKVDGLAHGLQKHFEPLLEFVEAVGVSVLL